MIRKLTTVIAMVIALACSGCSDERAEKLGDCKVRALQTFMHEDPSPLTSEEAQAIFVSKCMHAYGYKAGGDPDRCSVIVDLPSDVDWAMKAECYEKE